MMSYTKLMKRALALALAFLVGFAGVWAAAQAGQETAGVGKGGVSAPVMQNPSADNPAAVAAPDASTWVTCTPVNVGVYSTRIHVKCNESYSGIRYFAYPTTDAAAVARYLSVLTSAQVADRTLSVLYNPADSTSGVSYGCGASDCRPLQAVLLN